jgi:hypothetical protein
VNLVGDSKTNLAIFLHWKFFSIKMVCIIYIPTFVCYVQYSLSCSGFAGGKTQSNDDLSWNPQGYPRVISFEGFIDADRFELTTRWQKGKEDRKGYEYRHFVIVDVLILSVYTGLFTGTHYDVTCFRDDGSCAQDVKAYDVSIVIIEMGTWPSFFPLIYLRVGEGPVELIEPYTTLPFYFFKSKNVSSWVAPNAPPQGPGLYYSDPTPGK